MLLSISSRTAAHPRAGGENPHKVEFDVPTNGSSPRGRGKRVALGSCVGGVGLIPARAGKTTNARMTRASPRAHPRAGGENPPSASAKVTTSGSSPRGRGKRFAASVRNRPAGLIPARAGKTWDNISSAVSSAAHPRAGGENRRPRGPRGGDRGSSPRGRGKHFLTCAFIERIGQILETLELAVSSGSYSLCDVYATDAPQDQARNTGLALPSSRAAS